jgi:1,4-dihydroxy-2-naphthoate octaprenyltransferase
MTSAIIFFVNIANCFFMVGMMQSTYLRSTVHVRVTVAFLTAALFLNALSNLYDAIGGRPHGSDAELLLSLAILVRFISNAIASSSSFERKY